MKLLEYEAKLLIKGAGIPVPNSYLVSKESEFLPAVIKSQVPTGGRGKAGGIVIVHSEDEFRTASDAVRQLTIKDFLPRTLLAEELLVIRKEFYLSFIIDKQTATIALIAHRVGGIEVEENDPESFLRIALDGKNSEVAGEQLADYYDLPEQSFFLQDMIKKLYALFVDQDMTLLEINPLVLTGQDTLVAGDAKVVLDDAAVFRHKEWNFEAEKLEANFVTLDENGTIATIANGAGLAMATVDAAADAGMQPANFLDIGGGANETSVLAAFERILRYPNIKVIVINIFAGITRCDEVAKAIIAARQQIKDLPILAIRLAGTNYEQAADLLAAENIQIHPDLESALDAAKRVA